jgi:hypothetical protein
MAKIPRPSRSRKRLQDTGIAATSLRRSRRIAHRTIFRFNDLPPELRNAIYSMSLRYNDGRAIALVADLPATAKALSQVSRTVRTESLSVFYSENGFIEYFRYWDDPNAAQQEVSHIGKWFAVFGKLAAPHLRISIIGHPRILLEGCETWLMSSGKQVELTHDGEYLRKLRAACLARIARQCHHFHRVHLDRLDDFPIGVFGASGLLRLRPEALRLLLIGLQLVAPCATLFGPSLIAAALLSKLWED